MILLLYLSAFTLMDFTGAFQIHDRKTVADCLYCEQTSPQQRVDDARDALLSQLHDIGVRGSNLHEIATDLQEIIDYIFHHKPVLPNP